MNTPVADMTPKNEIGLSFSIYFFADRIICTATAVVVATVISLTTIWIIFPSASHS